MAPELSNNNNNNMECNLLHRSSGAVKTNKINVFKADIYSHGISMLFLMFPRTK